MLASRCGVGWDADGAAMRMRLAEPRPAYENGRRGSSAAPSGCVKSDEARVPLALLVLALDKVRVPDVALDLGAFVLGEALLALAVLGEALLVAFDLRV